MTSDYIRDFLAIEKLKSFSEAADMLCISQSSLSKQIKALEDELGFSLFIRNKRGIELTEEGVQFAHYARVLFDTYSDMLNALHSRQSAANVIRLGTIQVLDYYELDHMIDAFELKYPQYQVHLYEYDSDGISKALQGGDVDVALIRDFNAKEKYSIKESILSDELVLVSSKQLGIVTINDAKQMDFLLLTPQCGINDFCIDACINAGFIPRVRDNTIKIRSIVNFVEKGKGVSLLFRKTVEPYLTDRDITAIPLDPPAMSKLQIVGMFESSTSTAAVKNFVRFSTQFFNQP